MLDLIGEENIFLATKTIGEAATLRFVRQPIGFLRPHQGADQEANLRKEGTDRGRLETLNK